MRTLMPAPAREAKQRAATDRRGAVERADITLPLNRTGMPDRLKSGIESLSGLSMEGVRVNYNSTLPAPLAARAFAQGSQIHLAPGQEHHLPHEAWHVVQQKQGRVRPTMRLAGTIAINDDESLEREADRMGAMALWKGMVPSVGRVKSAGGSSSTIQCNFETEDEAIRYFEDKLLPNLRQQTTAVEPLRQLAKERNWQKLEASIALGLASQPGLLIQMRVADAFKAMLEACGKPYEASYGTIVEKAHEPSQSLAEDQVRYQALLTDSLSLSRAQIMEFHRSAGFEYEFTGFYDRGKPQGLRSGDEILRSHIELARSAVSGSVFALPFSLETDSYNALEMVTPPFVFLVASDTSKILKRTDVWNREALIALRSKLEQPESSLIADHLPEIADAGFGSGWTWVYGKEPELSASRAGAKHVSKILGQVNLSLTPAEIVALTSLMITKNATPLDKNARDAQLTPTYVLFEKIYEKVRAPASPEMNGIFGLYAKSVSSIIGIPSILYRSRFAERPEDGNFATSLKETLGLWVKDFPYAVIIDYLASESDKTREVFAARIEETAGEAAEYIKDEITGNLKTLEKLYINTIDKRFSSSTAQKNSVAFAEELNAPRIAEIALISKDDVDRSGKISAINSRYVGNTKTIMDYSKDLKKIYAENVENAPEKFADFAKGAEHEVGQEFKGTVRLLLEGLKKTPDRPKVPQRDEPETFGTGQGVRKETFLGVLPGARKLRVAEIRSSDDLEDLEEELAKIRSV